MDKPAAALAARLGIEQIEAETAELLNGNIYATWDGKCVWLRSLDGNAIPLLPKTWRALQAYVGPGATKAT